MSNNTENKPRPNLVGSPNIDDQSSKIKIRKKQIQYVSYFLLKFGKKNRICLGQTIIICVEYHL